MMKKLASLCFVLVVTLIASCSSTDDGPSNDLLPPTLDRQTELTHMYDRLGSANDVVAKASAREAASGNDRDHRFLESLWGTRELSPAGARHFGQALAKADKHQRAFDWFQRAYLALDAGDALEAWLRYEMAEQLVELGRSDDAIDLLTNRVSLDPLPVDLEGPYRELLTRASRATG